MAKKKDNIDNMDDFDDWDSDFDDFNFDDEFPDIKNRKPLDSVKAGLLSGLKSSVSGTIKTLQGRINKEMPKTSSVISDTKDTVSEAKYLAEQFTRDIQPGIISTKRALKAVSPKLQSVMSEDKLKKLQSLLETEEEYRPESEESRRESEITDNLTTIFAADMEDREEKYQEEKEEKVVDRALASKRHGDLTELLQGIRLATTSVDTFNKTVNMAYYKKSLELQYQHLFVAKDTFKVAEQQAKMMEAKLDQIRHNTGLPDIQKYQTSELWADAQRQRIASGALSLKENLLRGALTKVGQKLQSTSSGFNSMAGILGMAAEGIGQQGGDFDLASFIGGQVGKGAGKIAGERLNTYMFGRDEYDAPWWMPEQVANLVFGKVKDGGKLSFAKRRGEALSNNFNHKLGIELAHMKDQSEFGSMMNGLLSFIAPDLVRGAGTVKNNLRDPSEPAPFDQGTRLSIVEIIPGYLSKILQQVTTIATGDPSTEEMVFDINKRKFDTMSQVRKNIVDQAFGSTKTRQENMNKTMGVLRGGMLRNSGDATSFDNANDDMRIVVGNIMVNKLPVDRKILKKYINGDELKYSEENYIKMVFKNVNDPMSLAEILYKSASGSSTADADFINDAFVSSTMDTMESDNAAQQLRRYIDSGMVRGLDGLVDISTSGFKINDKVAAQLYAQQVALTKEEKDKGIKQSKYSEYDESALLREISEYEEDISKHDSQIVLDTVAKMDGGIRGFAEKVLRRKAKEENPDSEKSKMMQRKERHDAIVKQKKIDELSKEKLKEEEATRLLRERSTGDYDFFNDEYIQTGYVPQKNYSSALRRKRKAGSVRRMSQIHEPLIEESEVPTMSVTPVDTSKVEVSTSGIEEILERFHTKYDTAENTRISTLENIRDIKDILNNLSISSGGATVDSEEGSESSRKRKSRGVKKFVKSIPGRMRDELGKLYGFGSEHIAPGIRNLVGRTFKGATNAFGGAMELGGSLFRRATKKGSELIDNAKTRASKFREEHEYLFINGIPKFSLEDFKLFTYEDGTPVDPDNIDRPVIDQNGKIVISKEDIEKGIERGKQLVEVGKEKGKSFIGKGYDLAKKGTKKAGSLASSTATRLKGLLGDGDKAVLELGKDLYSGAKGLISNIFGRGGGGSNEVIARLDKIILQLKYGFNLTDEQMEEVNSILPMKSTISKLSDTISEKAPGMFSKLKTKVKGIPQAGINLKKSLFDKYKEDELAEDKELADKEQDAQEDKDTSNLSKMTGYLKNISEKSKENGGMFKSLLMLIPTALGSITSMLGGLLTKFGLGGVAKSILGSVGGSILGKGASKLFKGVKGIGSSILGKLGIGAGAKVATDVVQDVAMKEGSEAIAKTTGKEVLETGVKTTGKEVAEAGAKAGGKGLLKGFGKGALKSVAKKIPILGGLAGLGFGINRLLKGDLSGAAMEVMSGLASTIPGVGTAASVALDAGLAAKDVYSTTTDTDSNTSITNTTGFSPSDMMAPSHDQESSITMNENLNSELSKIKPVSSHGPKLGDMFSKFESGSGGSSTIGYDRVGGTSYGKYQIASKPGTFDSFLKYLKGAGGDGPKISKLFKGLTTNTFSKDGDAPYIWRELAKRNALGYYEHGFIKHSHYDPAMKKLNPEVASMVNNEKVLQEVLWSTAVQHGASGAAKIFNGAYKKGMTNSEFIKAIYAKRGTQFGSSTSSVRQSVLNRFQNEQAMALANLSSDEPSLMDSSGSDSSVSTASGIAMSTPSTTVSTTSSGSTQTTSSTSSNIPRNIQTSTPSTPSVVSRDTPMKSIDYTSKLDSIHLTLKEIAKSVLVLEDVKSILKDSQKPTPFKTAQSTGAMSNNFQLSNPQVSVAQAAY